MPKILSKLVKKIPPFKNVYKVLNDLKVDIKKLNNENEELNKELNFKIEELKKKNTELERKNKELEAKHCEMEKTINKNFDNEEKKSQEKFNQLSKSIWRTKSEINKEIIYYYNKGLHPDQYEENLKEWFYNQTGEILNLENPKTYNEKIQWMKLYDSTQQKADLADKYKVREYVKEKIGGGYLIPLLGVWDKASDIPFSDLPDRFVLKTNHGCGYNIIVKDKSKMDVKDSINKLNKWMSTDFSYVAGFEMHYKLIERKIIVEEYIENLDGDVYDYKVFCFDGKAKYIMFISGRQSQLKRAFYDMDWNLMPFVYSHEIAKEPDPKPDNLDELISISEKLAEGFPHVRVDFYQLNTGEWKFGEMTFTPMSGICKWNPPEYNRIFGDMIKLPKKTDFTL